MKWIIAGVVIRFLETWYFGWNWWVPSCEAERSWDEATALLIFVGMFQYIIHEESKWILRTLKKALKESEKACSD